MTQARELFGRSQGSTTAVDMVDIIEILHIQTSWSTGPKISRNELSHANLERVLAEYRVLMTLNKTLFYG